MKRILLCLPVLFLLQALPLSAQNPISLEAIWLEYEFWANSVPGFNFLNDGKHYTRKEGNQVTMYDLTTGRANRCAF